MASPASDTVAVRPTNVPRGVPPLRAGQGRQFFWRRLHSLSGIIPVGAFLIEHFISNAFATNGPQAYTDQVKFLTGLPFAFWLEVFGIYIPLLFHGGYGLWIWWRGESNAGGAYPWTNNWMYGVQRWTGIIAFAYIFFHTWEMRFSGVHLFDYPQAAFWKVENSLQSPLVIGAYVIGILCASWHFGYGIFLFSAKWGLVTGERGRRRMQRVGILIAGIFMAIGLYTMSAFIKPKADWPKQQYNPEWSQPRHGRTGEVLKSE